MLIEMNSQIKTVLGMRFTNAAKCIQLLESFEKLDLTPLMLLKNPSCVETIKRCRRYVGNVHYWGYTPEQIVEFKEQSSRIRMLADDIYKQIKVI